jgi:hypothetical protein
MMASTENAQIPRWAEEVKSASYRVERAGRNRGAEDHEHSDAAAGSLAHMEALRREASGHDEQRRKSLAENLLNTVELANCEFVADHNEFGRLKAAHAPKDGDVVVEDTAKWPGLQAHMHADGHGATFTVDQRVNTWLTRGGRSATIRHVSSDRSGRLGRRADPQRAGSTRTRCRARALARAARPRIYVPK